MTLNGQHKLIFQYHFGYESDAGDYYLSYLGFFW